MYLILTRRHIDYNEILIHSPATQKNKRIDISYYSKDDILKYNELYAIKFKSEAIGFMYMYILYVIN